LPNRILRDWTDSYAVNDLDAQEERFFVRLIMKADDFGRFHADPRLLKANLFPLLPETRDTDISRWLAACEKAGLLRCYVDGRGRQFLEIQNFRQRTRQMKAKFPSAGESPTDESPPDDGQLTVNRQSIDCQLRTETETETETKSAPQPARDVGAVSTPETQQLGERLQDLFPVLATNRPQLEKTYAALRARHWTAETLDNWLVWFRRERAKLQLSHFNLLNTLNDYAESGSLKNGAGPKRVYCGQCVGGWVRPDPTKGETRARRCDCVKGAQ